MTDKQARFVDEYMIDCNATAAAKRAGYADSTAESQASLWVPTLGKTRDSCPDGYTAVWDAIEARRQALRQSKEVTQERVIEEYRRIAFADVRSLFTWDEERAAFVPSRDLTDEEAAAVQSVKAKTTHRTHRRTDGEDERETEIQLELKTYDKLKALSDLGKHLGLFGPDGSEKNPLHIVPIQINVINQQGDSKPHVAKVDTQGDS